MAFQQPAPFVATPLEQHDAQVYVRSKQLSDLAQSAWAGAGFKTGGAVGDDVTVAAGADVGDELSARQQRAGVYFSSQHVVP